MLPNTVALFCIAWSIVHSCSYSLSLSLPHILTLPHRHHTQPRETRIESQPPSRPLSPTRPRLGPPPLGATQRARGGGSHGVRPRPRLCPTISTRRLSLLLHPPQFTATTTPPRRCRF
ncbi:hypothetical protein RIF29_38057 [Crotalaria pallida]|uniref:Secreted protein n=1 Tax=Crotalaria pallida TaxID=3830 RepID=A0AAN9E402_CROPI